VSLIIKIAEVTGNVIVRIVNCCRRKPHDHDIDDEDAAAKILIVPGKPVQRKP